MYFQFKTIFLFENKKSESTKINDINTTAKKKRRIVRTFINTLKYYRIRAKTVCVNKNKPCLTHSNCLDKSDTIHCFLL